MTRRNLLRRIVRHPRGVAAMLFGLMLPVFIGFMALSVDTAMIALARSQLSTAADSAALAGAQQLANEYRVRGVTDMTGQIASANAQAAAFAADNRALGRGVTVVQNPSNAAGGDVLVGYKDPNAPGAPLVTDPALASLFNSVQVTAARSASRGGVVPTVFGSLMGFHGATITVPSTATAQNYAVAGFKSVENQNAHLLPIVLDVTTYNAMTAGQTTDQYTFNPTTKSVTSGPDGVDESQLFPVRSGSPGNWGLIKVGVFNNSASTISDQIQYGITPSQLATYPNGVIQLDTTQSPPSITFSGNPGIKASLSSALQSIIGQPVVIPIYDQNGGNGNNAWYRVIAFAPVRILSVNFQGNPKYVVVQPALLNDPTVIHGAAQSSWKAGGQVVLHLTR